MVSSHEFSILKRNSRDYNFVKAKTEKTQENLVEILIQFLPNKREIFQHKLLLFKPKTISTYIVCMMKIF